VDAFAVLLQHDDEKTVEKQVHEKPEKMDGASSSSSTSYIRQSSTKTEAVARFVEFPVLNHFVQSVTSCSNPGTYSGDALMMKSEEDTHKKPEKRDVENDISLKGKHDDKKTVEKQVHEKPEKNDVKVDINPEGRYDDEKKEERQLYEKSEKTDLVADINSEGKYDDNNLVEDNREHLIKGDG
jgi:hypothetical protein